MDLVATLERDLAKLDRQTLRRQRRVSATPSAPRITVDGRNMLAFCSNDYLGLAAHPRVVEALKIGASLYGVGSGASHLISGHSRAHALLEECFADFLSSHLESPRALYFCTGYMANIAVLSTLAGRDTDIFSEELNHASLIDGVRLSRANVEVYPHANADALECMLKTSQAKTKIVVTDGVFSMDGDVAPLPRLLRLCEQHGAWLIVDDAHGFGVLGQHGRGVLEHFGLRSPNLVYIGTLGKAAGVGGACVAAHATVIEWLVQRARPYIYTTAAAPALAHALLTSMDLIMGEEGVARRSQLASLIAQLHRTLMFEHWKLLPSHTAIQPVLIGANQETMRASAMLYEQGYWVPGIRPPTVPSNTARLRLTLSASHTLQEVTELASALNVLEKSV